MRAPRKTALERLEARAVENYGKGTAVSITKRDGVGDEPRVVWECTIWSADGRTAIYTYLGRTRGAAIVDVLAYMRGAT